MRGVVPVLVSLLILPALFVAGPSLAQADPTQAPCGDGTSSVIVEDVVLESGGETVHGCFAFPADGTATVDTLVVMVHGFGHTVQASWVPHMIETVESRSGVAAVAMNFRDNFGFPIFRGAEDTIRGTHYALDRLPDVDTTILYSISLGAAIGGTAIHIAPDYNDGAGLYDHWFAIEPAANPLETYIAAKAVAPFIPIGKTASEGMERDAGGNPAEAPEAWALRIPVLHTAAMKATGLQDVVVVHGLNDGLVPYDQGRGLVQALRAADVPVEMHSVARGAPDHTSGTTPTSHAGQPQYDPNEQVLHLAGHGSEADRDHIVTATGLERLFAFLGGASVEDGHAEFLVDDGLGTHRLI